MQAGLGIAQAHTNVTNKLRLRKPWGGDTGAWGQIDEQET